MTARVSSLLAVLALLATAAAAAAQPTPPGPDAAIADWPDWPYPTSCGGEEFDPLVAFSGTTGAENGSSPAEGGLRETIKEQEDWYESLPARGWRRISESGVEAQFTRGTLAGQLEWLSLEREPDGTWDSNRWSSDCEPTTVLPGKAVVTWSLARKQKRLNPNSRTLWIDLGPGGCASGALQNPRAHFRFRSLGKRLLMIAWLEPVHPSGGSYFTCEGTVEPPRKVRLPQTLGEARLFDGATFPPVPAGKTRTRYD